MYILIASILKDREAKRMDIASLVGKEGVDKKAAHKLDPSVQERN